MRAPSASSASAEGPSGEENIVNVTAPALNLAPLLDVQGCCKSFRKPDGDELLVLENVHLTLRPGEIVGLLGRSGSGKSTLLRAIAGLDEPSAGVVNYLGHPVTGPAAGIAMVFQSFALFPWLTVLENVQLGLEALGMPEPEMRRRSLQAIDLIGLDGFESAYPRELSGGMRQRVGFARALVVHPNILLMDEPVSALDVLTAETLRNDFLNLWGEGQLPIRSVLLVTHNIEEAVEMCDRLLIFSTKPGRVVGEIPVDLPQPRHALDPRFRALVDRVYVEMTAKPRGERVGPRTERFPGTGIGTTLTHVSSNVLAGLMQAVSEPPYDGQADLPAIAQALHMEVDDLFPAAEALQLLRLAEVEGGDIRLTEAGLQFARDDTDDRKKLFARHLVTYVPLAAHVRRVLDERASHSAPKSRFFDELEDYMAEEAAEQTLRTIISWGRYGEVFAYDDHRQRREIVFHVLEGAQDRLPVRGHALIVVRDRGPHLVVTGAEIDQGAGEVRSQRPEAIRQLEQLREAVACVTPGGSERERRKPCRARHADLGVGGGGAALGGGDVGAALEQLRGQRQRDRRDRRRLILARDRQRRRRLADEHCDGVLEGRTGDAEVEPLGARVLELRLRLGHVRALRDARLVAILRDLERLLVTVHRALQQCEIQVRHAQLEVSLGERRLLREQHGGQIARARLGRGAVGFDGAADAPPHIDLPVGGEAHAILGGGAVARRRRAGGSAAAATAALAARGGDIGGDRGKVARARGAEQRQRLVVFGRCEQHVLIGHLHLAHEGVELRIAVEVPPVAARLRVLWLGRLPVAGPLVACRHLDARAVVDRADRQVLAAGHGGQSEEREAPRRAPTGGAPTGRAAHEAPCSAPRTLAGPRGGADSSGFEKRCKRAFAHSRKRSRYRYMTGVVYRVNSWLRNSPPTTAMPSGRRSSAPSPLPIASGSAPNIAAMVVMRIGRRRSRHAW